MRPAKSYWRFKYALIISGLILSISFLAAFQLSGASRLVSEASFRLSGNPFIALFAYLLIFGFLYALVLFPLDFCEGFMLERRFGLSVEPFTAWLKDEAKRSMLSSVFFIVMVEAVYAMALKFPHYWWILSAAFWIAVSVFLAKIFPVIIIPLFYSYKPLSKREIKDRVLGLAGKFGINVIEVCEIDFSKKTRKSNAAVVGLGGTRRVILADNLVNEFGPEEVCAVVAHEMAHHKRRHMWQLLAMSAASTALFFFILHKSFQHFSGGISDIALFPAAYLLFMLYEMIAMPARHAFSRRLEREADEMAIAATGSAEDFISMMRKLSEKNLADERPGNIMKWLFYSHPPVSERIRMAEEMRRDGEKKDLQ